jgi:hypothetical protein
MVKRLRVSGSDEMDCAERQGVAGVTTGAPTPFFELLLSLCDLTCPVGPEHAIAHRTWQAARDQALAAVLGGPCLVLVVGPAGTGKTLLLEELARVCSGRGEPRCTCSLAEIFSRTSPVWGQ